MKLKEKIEILKGVTFGKESWESIKYRAEMINKIKRKSKSK